MAIIFLNALWERKHSFGHGIGKFVLYVSQLVSLIRPEIYWKLEKLIELEISCVTNGNEISLLGTQA